MRAILNIILPLVTGAVNALFGAGGGIVAVPALKRRGLSQKQAQASALAVMLPVSIVSAIVYYMRGNYDITEAIRFIPFGVIGCLIGNRLMKKVSNRLLRILFALFMIYSGIRMILR